MMSNVSYSTSPNILIKLSKNASIPRYGSHGSAGLDLTSTGAYSIAPGERQVISTGVSMSIPSGHYGKIEGRSGLALRNGIIVGGGVIDSDYTGEIKVILINTGNMHFVINKDDRIAQIIIHSYISGLVLNVVDELPSTQRGENGFGSTGIKKYFNKV